MCMFCCSGGGGARAVRPLLILLFAQTSPPPRLFSLTQTPPRTMPTHHHATHPRDIARSAAREEAKRSDRKSGEWRVRE